MLKALYDYAVHNVPALPAGAVRKTIKAYISLDSQTDYVGIILGDEKAIPCPDIGSLANGTDKSNVIVEKRSVVIPKSETVKSRFFLDALKSAAEWEPLLLPCVKALESAEGSERIRQRLDQEGIKLNDRISFMVNGQKIVESERLLEWWQAFRKQFQSANEKTTLCLITGEDTTPVETTPKIQGMRSVGGHSSGDALICFDKPAFQSYGFKQGANAPVSEEAFSAVKSALDSLLKDAPTLAGMKFVHWYDRRVEPEDDPILCEDFFGIADDDEVPDEESPEERKERESSSHQLANQLVESVRDESRRIHDLSDIRYYILLLSGVNGRVMIRRYECGNYQLLRDHLKLWREDLSLVNSLGTDPVKGCELNERLMRLLLDQKNDSRAFERLKKEERFKKEEHLGKKLSGITSTITIAILTGAPLPDSVAARALAYIRSRILGADSDDTSAPIPDVRACQWLKVWLIRKHRFAGEEEFLMDRYNMEHPNPAYHCGGIMAVFASIQKTAMSDVSAGVIQRYYNSACQTPALVIGMLSRLSNYHLEKIQNPGVARVYSDLRNNLFSILGNQIPVTLNLEEQSYFALGYYQMLAKLNQEKKERIAEKKQAEAKEALNENQEENRDGDSESL